MIDLENHKGHFCQYVSIFCQEGYCSSCQIYPKKTSPNMPVSRYDKALLPEHAGAISFK